MSGCLLRARGLSRCGWHQADPRRAPQLLLPLQRCSEAQSPRLPCLPVLALVHRHAAVPRRQHRGQELRVDDRLAGKHEHLRSRGGPGAHRVRLSRWVQQAVKMTGVCLASRCVPAPALFKTGCRLLHLCQRGHHRLCRLAGHVQSALDHLRLICGQRPHCAARRSTAQQRGVGARIRVLRAVYTRQGVPTGLPCASGQPCTQPCPSPSRPGSQAHPTHPAAAPRAAR